MHGKPRNSKGKLSAREAAFVAAYAGNGAAAAKAAGYRGSTAVLSTQACRLLKKAEVVAAIAKRQARHLADLELSPKVVLDELKRLALVDISLAYDEKGELLPLHKMPEDVRRAVAGLEHGEYGPKLRTWDKVKALELLGKNLKLFTDRVEHSGHVSLETLVERSIATPEPTK